ncbi:hypothetical protein BDM02DRAFT_3179968 [Thelephora ganbajun]|uniref:Uncharacterized protein n=1 Tax=Thelephora ganbajun TaxID=370292 RepID=A0ACB6ZHT3_THEGA|nr:hypothetical protein BDM02DRAFT_3179968 [Thelephora ganbajun]
MPLDVLGHMHTTLTEPVSFSPWPEGIPSKRELSAHVDYVPALCTHCLSLLPIEWLSEVFGLASEGWKQPTVAEKLIKLGHLEEVKVVTRFLDIVFERLISNQVGLPAELKHINKRRKRN